MIALFVMENGSSSTKFLLQEFPIFEMEMINYISRKM